MLLFGASGILGSGFCEYARRNALPLTRLSLPWAEPRAVRAELESALPRYVSADSPAVLVWAAGSGHIGASADMMDAETEAVRAMADTLRRLSAPQRAELTVVFASSAGALFGSHGTSIVSEDSTPAPLTAYGEAKLDQEDILRRLADDIGCRVVSCRYSNLYGLAAGRLPPRGLIPVAVRATRLRQPMTVYVSPDTRRDLVFNEDAAALSLRSADDAAQGFTTVLVRDGATRTVADILSLIGRVSGRRVPVTYGERPETRLQPRVLRFSRPMRGPDSVRRTSMETAIHRMLRAPMVPG